MYLYLSNNMFINNYYINKYYLSKIIIPLSHSSSVLGPISIGFTTLLDS